MRFWAVTVAMLLTGPAVAAQAVSCGSFAMQGGAEILCSTTDPAAPAQLCTFSWSLMSPATGLSIVTGSFLLRPALKNAIVYQGSGYAYPLTSPVVLCQPQ